MGGSKGKVAIEVELSTKKFDKQIEKLESDLEKINYEYNAIKKDDPFEGKTEELKKYRAEAERVRNKIIELKKRRDELNNQGMSNIKQMIGNIGNQTEGLIKKVARWGLAIFGIRSAYLAVRQAMSTLSQYNEQMGVDLQYIKFAIATTLQPLIEGIINLAYKLLIYINYIAKAWFGVNLFANASAKAFQKTSAGVKDTNKNAKQLQKTLAGFDEMNILQKDGSTSSGGGGGGITLPTSDLSQIAKDIDIPGWLEAIGQNGKLVKEVLLGIGGAIVALKLGELVFYLTGTAQTLPQIITALSKMSGLQLAGLVGSLAVAVAGIYKTIVSIVTFIQDPSWENFADILNGLALALSGVGAAMLIVNSNNPIGWITLAVALTTEWIKVIGNLISSQDEEVKSTKSVSEADRDLANAKKELNNATNKYKNAQENLKKAEKELIELEKQHKVSGKSLYDQVVLGTLTYDGMTQEQKDVYLAYLSTLDAQQSLADATTLLTEKTNKEKEAEKQRSASIYASQKTYDGYFKTLLEGFNNGTIKGDEMAKKTASVMQYMDEETRRTFAENLPDNVKKAFAEAGNIVDVFDNGVEVSYREVANASKKTFETDVPNSVKKTQNAFANGTKEIQKFNNELAKTKASGNVKVTVSKSSGNYQANGAIYYPPRLAVGGVINQPGRGVPLAMGGEKGAEGVIPLTDAQQMQRLGEAIGKYITVNANIINTMNGRVISRELKQIENEEAFAFNGG